MPDPIPAVPIYGMDYQALCAAPPCPACAQTGPVCEEWMGHYGAAWCPRCGWARRFHPKESNDA